MKQGVIKLVIGILSCQLLGANSYPSQMVSLEKIKQEIKKTVTAHLTDKYQMVSPNDIKIVIKNGERIAKKIPQDAQSLKINIKKHSKVLGRSTIKVFYYDEKKRFIQQNSVILEVNAFAKVPHAKSIIEKGHTVTQEDIGYDYKSLASLQRNILLDTTKILGNVATFTIHKESPFIKWMIQKTPLIKYGDIIKVVHEKKNISLKIMGKALQAGYLGDKIKVKLNQTKKIIMGEIVGTSNVKMGYILY